MESAAHAAFPEHALPEEDALASLEERIRRAAELVTTLRAERDAAIAELDNIRKAAGGALADSQKLKQEVESLRGERKQVRTRIEKLLGQMELL
jgi:FtsZ-binding cell division protein ZapB